MALPNERNAQELQKLKARVAELEAELKTFKPPENEPGQANINSIEEELQHLQSVENVQTEEEISTATVEQGSIQYGSELLVEETQITEEMNLLSNVEVANVIMSGQLQVPETPEEQATLIDGEFALPTADLLTPSRRKGKHSCPECGKKFPFMSELNRHRGTHKPNDERDASKKLMCDICQKRFHWKCDLSRHVLTHGTARPHVCTVCNAAFKLSEGLKKHMIIHSESSVKCTTCYKSYRSMSSLRSHACTRVTNQERSFICEICDKGFTRKDILNVHLRSHTGERPYVCDICNKGFNTASKRSAHMPTHRNRPYICKGCKKSFMRVDALQSHFHLDDKVWYDNLKLRDVQVVQCSDDKVIVNMDTCIELSDSEMDADEINSQESGQPVVPEASPTSEFLTTTPAAPTEPTATTEPSAEPSSSTEPAAEPVATTEPVTSIAEAIIRAQETEQETAPSEVNLNNYQQLLVSDKDGNSLIQLHVLPSDDGKFHVVASTKDGSDSNTASSSMIIGTLSGNTENGSPNVTLDISTTTPPKTKGPSTTPFPIHDLHKLPKVLNTISVVALPGYPVPPCILCNEVFDNVDAFTEHLLVHMSPKLYRCVKCFIGFDCLEELDTHECSPPTYDCHKCSQSFNEYCSLLNHIATAHKKDYVSSAKQTRNRTRANYPGISKSKALETLICWYCEDSFPSKAELEEHSKALHTGNYPFKCKYCEKAYAKKPYLRAHIRTHTGEKHPHQCHLCDKNFCTSQRLKIHVRSHTGERPYKCDVCSKGFHRKYVLILHKRSHTGEKPYGCNFCHKKYKCYTDLRRHTEEIHEGRRYPCKDCGKLFKRSTYRSHMIRTHGAYKPPDTSDFQLPGAGEAIESAELSTIEAEEIEGEEVDMNVLVDGVMESPMEGEVVSVDQATAQV